GPEMSGTWTSSSSSPTLTSSAMRSSGVPEAGNWVCSRIHDRGMRIWLNLHSEVLAEPDVAFNHVAHIQHPVAEHQGPLHTHAEGEAGVLRVCDTGGAQHIGVHHPAAAPFDPLGATL